MNLSELENEIIGMLDKESCPYSMNCTPSDYGSEPRCNDHVMCPSFREYVCLYVNSRIVDYTQEVINQNL